MKTALLMIESDRGWFLATLYRGRQVLDATDGFISTVAPGNTTH
jgi:hypothetical protein